MNTEIDDQRDDPNSNTNCFPMGQLVVTPTALDVKIVSGKNAAVLYFQELTDSVESLTGIAEEHGARTLTDLMFLENAILSGGFIDHYPDESKVLEIASALPSGDQWSKFIQVG